MVKFITCKKYNLAKSKIDRNDNISINIVNLLENNLSAFILLESKNDFSIRPHE